MIDRPPYDTALEGDGSRAADGSVRVAGGMRRAAEAARRRIHVCALLFLIAFSVVSFRLAGVSILGLGADDRAQTTQIVRGPRPEIHDRNGVLLAVNLPAYELHIDGREVWDAAETAAAVTRVLPEMDADALAARLQEGRYFPVNTALTPDEKARLFALGLPGLRFEARRQRVYPQGRLAAHLVGHVNADGEGVFGLERALDDRSDVGVVRASVDLRAQQILSDVMAKGMAQFSAKAGWATLMDVDTGEIVALVSLPDFDPNVFATSADAFRRNRVTLDVYEMGSAFKAFTLAMALDGGWTTLGGQYDARRPLRIAGHVIHDFHGKNRVLSVPEVFIYSSNIGTAKMALDVGVDAHRDFLGQFRMFDRLDSELIELGKPLTPPVWRDVNTATIAYGHGLAVTPLHLVAGLAALVNGGEYVPPTFLADRGGAPTPRTRVISEETSVMMRGLFRLAVTEGTGGKADAPGYWVGGKTATAEKSSASGYDEDRLLSSFVGVFPGHAPRYVLLVSLDEPQGVPETHGYATAGWTAAPLAGEAIARLAPVLGVRAFDYQQTDLEGAPPHGESAPVLGLSPSAPEAAFHDTVSAEASL